MVYRRVLTVPKLLNIFCTELPGENLFIPMAAGVCCGAPPPALQEGAS